MAVERKKSGFHCHFRLKLYRIWRMKGRIVMKRAWKAGAFILLAAAVCCVFAAVHLQKKAEIIWYLDEPGYFGVDRKEIKPYQEVYAKRFQLFNDRLTEMGISAKVVFKYAPDQYECDEEAYRDGSWYAKGICFSGEKIRTLMQNDARADIAQFSSVEYDSFLSLDAYAESEGMKRAKEAIPEEIWSANQINGKTYQIPRGNACIKEAAYCFDRSFLNQYQVSFEEEKIKKMTPEEVVNWLLPYFEKDRLLDRRYCLTDASYLNFSDYLLGESMPVLERTTNNLYYNFKDKKITDSFSMKELRDGFALYQYIYENNLDAHEAPTAMTARPVFTIHNLPGVKELQRSGGEEDVLFIRLGNPYVTRSLGNGVLKSSKNQELAVQVLAASVYDEELSNLMIYGVPEEDYRLVDGHAVCLNEGVVSYMGTFGAVGNNLIAYPNEQEAADKEERTRKLLKEISMDPNRNFIPDWNEDLLKRMSEVAAIYEQTVQTLRLSEVSDLEAYLEKQQKKLEEAGLLEVVSELQEQVERWEEQGYGSGN